MADSETILRLLTERFPTQVTKIDLVPAQTVISIDPTTIVELFKFIVEKPELDLGYLSAISGVDRTDHIELVYFVSSLQHKHKLTIKTKVDRIGGKIDTIESVIPAANWFEREIWELFGVDFVGHPDLRQFLLADGWDQGHPMLRDWDGKDFIRMPEVS